MKENIYDVVTHIGMHSLSKKVAQKDIIIKSMKIDASYHSDFYDDTQKQLLADINRYKDLEILDLYFKKHFSEYFEHPEQFVRFDESTFSYTEPNLERSDEGPYLIVDTLIQAVKDNYNILNCKLCFYGIFFDSDITEQIETYIDPYLKRNRYMKILQEKLPIDIYSDELEKAVDTMEKYENILTFVWEKATDKKNVIIQGLLTNIIKSYHEIGLFFLTQRDVIKAEQIYRRMNWLINRLGDAGSDSSNEADTFNFEIAGFYLGADDSPNKRYIEKTNLEKADRDIKIITGLFNLSKTNNYKPTLEFSQRILTDQCSDEKYNMNNIYLEKMRNIFACCDLTWPENNLNLSKEALTKEVIKQIEEKINDQPDKASARTILKIKKLISDDSDRMDLLELIVRTFAEAKVDFKATYCCFNFFYRRKPETQAFYDWGASLEKLDKFINCFDTKKLALR